MSRGQRRKSALDARAATVIAPASTPTPVAMPAPARSAGVREALEAGNLSRLTVRVPTVLLEEVRAAWWSTAQVTGTRSMSAWVVEALEAYLERAQVEHNGGQSFPRMGVGEIPTGRR